MVCQYPDAVGSGFWAISSSRAAALVVRALDAMVDSVGRRYVWKLTRAINQ
jgi:hypothetical protein